MKTHIKRKKDGERVLGFAYYTCNTSEYNAYREIMLDLWSYQVDVRFTKKMFKTLKNKALIGGAKLYARIRRIRRR